MKKNKKNIIISIENDDCNKKGYILDKDYNVIDIVENIFSLEGSFSFEMKEKMKKYHLQGNVQGNSQDYYFGNGNSLEFTIEKIKKEICG